MIILFVLILIGGISAATMRFIRASGSGVDRALAGLLPLSAALLGIVMLTRIAQGPGQDWNEAKLAPIVGMRYGYALYQSPDTGAMTGWLYGPVGAIIMSPASLASDPTTAVFIGILIAAIVYLVPVGLAVKLACRERATSLPLLAFLVAAWESYDTDALSRCLVIAGPDAPALGLALCACAAIYRHRTWKTMHLSAIAAILCIWTKQNYLPLLVALPLWVALTDGLRPAGRFVGFIVGVGAILSSIFLLVFGAKNMLFHMLTLPGGHPYRDASRGTTVAWLIGLHDLLATCAAPLGMLAVALVLDSILSPREATWRDWIKQRPWLLYLLVAIFLVPASLAGYLKLGGYVNSLACTDFFLLISAVTAIVHILSVVEVDSQIRRAVAGSMLIFGLVIAIKANFAGVNGIVPSWSSIVHPYNNPQQQAFNYAKSHPGEVYCPWNPLTTLLAEKKLYHFEWGIVDRAVGDRPASDQQYLSHFPAKLDRVIYLRTPQSTKAMELLVDFRKRVRDPQLPDCIIYTR